MKSFSWSFIVLIMLSLMSCEMDILSPSDEATIEAMDVAIDKELISVADLPSEAQAILESDYATQIVEEVLSVEDLGYQVYLSTLRSNDSSSTCLYFNRRGSLLTGGVRHHQRSHHYGGYYYDASCFDLVFPITVIMPDNSQITGPDKDSVLSAIRAWYVANPDSMSRPTLQFPVTIMYADSSTLVINDETELRTARAACDDGDDDNEGRRRNRRGNHGGGGHGGGNCPDYDCFDLVYPVSYMMPDSSLITSPSQDSINVLIRTWFSDNPGQQGRPQLQFPVDIIFEDGTTQTVTTEAELRQALAACRDDDDDNG